ncbi:MAG: transposase [Massilia sp.]|jgi:hypothetical protein|nr:transposase [Massilia sp.]
MKQYSEDTIDSALRAIARGKSVKQAALEWGIPRTTLRHRIQGTQPRSIAFSGLQRLSKVQEDYLTQWILTQAALGLPPTHAQVRTFVSRILATKGDLSPLGKRWVASFLRRNPVIKTQRSKSIDSKRVNGATTDIIRPWFRLFEIPEVKAIKPANRWNMDEAGIMEGQGTNGLVLGSRQKVAIRRKQPGSRAWTSFVECISATGKHLPPLVIFKGQSVQQQWFPLDLAPYKPWQFTATEKGWITDSTAVEWLERVFIPGTKPATPEPRLLVVDGHGSHETTEFMWLCFQHNIRLLFLPPHTSHVLQPLDLAVFSALKTAYRKELGNLVNLTDSTAVGKRGFLNCYQRARLASLTGQNIRSGWKATGLWPVTMAKPLLSPLLLQNSNKPAIELVNSGTLEMASPAASIQAAFEGSTAVWSTPRKARDLRLSLSVLSHRVQPIVTRRQLFYKVQKAIDEKDVQLATTLEKVRSLEAQVEAAKRRKRRMVRTSPNSKFANIEAIHRAQVEAGEAENSPDESSESDIPSETGSCIVVGSVVVVE